MRGWPRQPHGHPRVANLPRLVLIGKIPQNSSYPKELKTLGDHIRARRLNLTLHQKQVAQSLGVDEATIVNWETGKTRPGFRHIPLIYGFLGYCPVQPTNGIAPLSQKIKLWREGLGMSQEELARAAGVDESSLADWEAGRSRPMRGSREKLERVFGTGQKAE